MALHHNSMRAYTAALIDLFNDLEVQYTLSTEEEVSSRIPIVFKSREKAKIIDKLTIEQIQSGNRNVFPRAALALVAMAKADQRTGNKNNRINNMKTADTIQYNYNSVPYEFTYELTFQCRGMTEATQIIEQIAPIFNPTVDVDVYDAVNLSEPTRVPVRLLDISLETEEYEAISSNIFTVVCGISIMGNLYPPIKSQERIQDIQIRMNEIIDDEYYKQQEVLGWDVDIDGNLTEQ